MFPDGSCTSLSRTPVTSVCCPVTMAVRVGRVSAGNSGLRLAMVPWLMRASMAGVGTRLMRLSVRPSVTTRITLVPLVQLEENKIISEVTVRIIVVLDLQVGCWLAGVIKVLAYVGLSQRSDVMCWKVNQYQWREASGEWPHKCPSQTWCNMCW